MCIETISSWRKPNSIGPIRGTEAVEESKPKLLEEALEYLITSYKTKKKTIQQLTQETLGIISSNCEALKKLSIDNSLFFYSIITNEIVCLICVLYFLDQNQTNNHITYTPALVKNWVTQQTGSDILAKKISENDIKSVKIESGKFIFNKKYQPLKLSKIEKYILCQSEIKSTKKIENNCLTAVYHNHNGLCLGAAKFFLIEMAKSHQFSSYHRNLIKDNYVRALEIQSQTFSNPTTTLFTDTNSQQKILELHSGNQINQDFHHVQDLHSTSQTINQDISKLINLMDINKISALYVLMRTHDHAMALVVKRIGVLIKITAYDPNNKNLYSHITIDPKNFDSNNFTKLIKTLSYFPKHDNHNFGLVLFCYTYKNLYLNVKLIHSEENILTINKQELLRLALITGQHELALQAFAKNAYYPEALIMAVDSLDCTMVGLVINKFPDSINYKYRSDYTTITALSYAESLKATTITKFLSNAQKLIDDNK